MATTLQLQQYYSSLLVLQYANKPKAVATIQGGVYPFLIDQMPIAVQNAFSVMGAAGVQLDVIGKYVGVKRTGVGFSGVITLTDAEFSQLIALAIIKNSDGSSLAQIQSLIQAAFSGAVVITDHTNMRLSVLIDSSQITNNVAQLFFTEELLPKPMGVQLSVPVYTTPINRFFGFRSARHPLVNGTPFNSVQNYHTNYPWLTVKDGLY